MEAGTSTFRSILDKPLNQLTEDDISQLTREDCRKFLKDKGMRRPSWNKSQAIQQVISLKALLEPTDDDSGTGSLRKLAFASLPQHSTPRGNLVSANCVKGISNDAKLSEPAEEPVLQKGEEASKSDSSGDRPAGSEINENAVSPRAYATSNSVGQMTIFYCGKVNVYDGIPLDKARAMMHLAASPLHSLQNGPLNNSSVAKTSLCQSQKAVGRDMPVHQEAATISQTAQPERMAEYPFQYRKQTSMPCDADMEGHASRKVSVQRYLEKKKDRGWLKNKKIAVSRTSSLEIYLNDQLKPSASNRNSGRSSTHSPIHPTMPQLSGGLTDNQLKVALTVDLNDKDIQQI